MSTSREKGVDLDEPEVEKDEENGQDTKASVTDENAKPEERPPANSEAVEKLFGDADDSWGALKTLIKQQGKPANAGDAYLVAAINDGKGDQGDRGVAAKPQLDSYFNFLSNRVEQSDRGAIRALMLSNSMDFLKNAYEQLSPDQKQELAALINDPQKLRSMAESHLTQALTKLLEDQIKDGKVKADDKERLLGALAKGELPPELLKAVLEKEKSSEKTGPVSEAMFTTMLNTAQEGAQRAARESQRLGRQLPPDCPVELTGGKADPKIDTKKVPSEEEIAKLEKLEKWNETARGPVNPQLDKLQETLLARVGNLDGAKIFAEVQKTAADGIKEQYAAGKLGQADKDRLDKAKQEGKLDEEINKLAAEKVKAALSAQLDRQAARNEISKSDCDARKKNLDKGIADPACVNSLLKQEREIRDNGTFTRATLAVLQKTYEDKVPETVAQFARDKKAVPGEKPVEAGKEKPGLGLTPGKVPTAEELSRFTEKLEKVEKWLAEADKVKNLQIGKLQDNIDGLLPAIDRPALKTNLIAELRADLERKHTAGDLPADQKKVLDDAFKAGRPEYEKKLDELAGARVKEMLKAEIDTQIRVGTFSETDRKKLEELVDKDSFPDELLRGMLAREYRANTFGPVTKALYKSAVNSMEEQAQSNFSDLTRAGMAVPADCPIPMRLNKFGRPEPSDGIRASMIAGTYKYESNIKTNDIPSDADLQALVRLAKWNQESSRSILNYHEDFQMKGLQETVVKMNRPEWLPKPGDDRQQWMMRVGPMVDMTMQVKSCAQALALVDKLANGSKVNFDREQLKKEFPGTLKLDKDGRIIEMKLDLPKDLTPSLENRQKLEKIQAWLDKNMEPAKKAMEELAKAAADQGRLLLWQDIPREKGNFKGTDYNLERHRFSIENVKVDGKEKIRVRNHVDYHQSQWYNYQDFGAKKLGSEQCNSIDPQLRDQIAKDFSAGKLPAEKMKELQDAQKSGPEAFEKALDKAATVSYRDYDPTDMVAVIKDGKIQMVMAKDLETWRAQQDRNQKIEKGVSIAFDVGMTVAAVVGIGAAIKAAHLAGTAASLAIRKAAMEVFKQELKHGLKNLALGGSGFVLNNSWAHTNEFGKSLTMARHVAFVADGIHGLYGIGKNLGGGALRYAGLMKPAELSAEAKNIAEASKLAHTWEAGKDASWAVKAFFGTVKAVDLSTKYTMLAGEGYLIYSMTGQAWKQGSDMVHPDKNPNLSAAGKILYRMRSSESDASRFLNNASATMAGTDSLKAQLLGDLNREINEASKLQPAEKQAKINDLIKKYDQAKTKEEKTLLAAGLLQLAGKDGQIPENIGTRKVDVRVPAGRAGYRTETRERPVKAREFFDELSKNTVSGDAAVKFVAAQTLITHGKLQMPEYATVCRQVLADDKAAKDLKMQAVMGLGYCVEAAGQQANSLQTGQERAAAIAGSFGCSREQLEKSLQDVASKDKDADVKAMAGALLHAMNSERKADKDSRLAEVQASWKAIETDRSIKNIEKELQRGELSPARKQQLEKDLERAKIEKQVALESMAVLRDPRFAQERVLEAQKREEERKQLAVGILQTSNDLKVLEAKLSTVKLEDKENLEKEIAAKREDLAKAQERLKELERQEKAPLPADKLPQVPESFAKENDKRWVRDLNAALPDDPEQRQQWAIKRMEAIKMLELTGSTAGGEASKEKINTALVDLANMNNGLVAVEALRMLIPSRVNDLKPEEKQAVVQSMHDIMNRPHFPSDNAAPEEMAKYREAAIAKTELVKLIPESLRSSLCSDTDKTEFKREVASLLNMASTNQNRATIYPDLRAAAVNSLGDMGPPSNETMNLIRDRLKFDGTGATGEPNAKVRIAAFEALKKLGDPELLNLVHTYMNNERDPNLAGKFGDMEFASMRPDRPENARRIYQLEVEYWTSVLERAEKRYSPKQIDDFFRENYPHVHPERYRQIKNDAEAKLKSKSDEIDNSTYFFGWFRPDARRDDHNAAITEFRHPYLNGHRDDWNKLVADARQAGEKGDKARACLMYLAAVDTTNGSGKQVEAAKEIRKLLKDGCPNREALFGQMIEAWRQRDISHEARKEFLDAIDDLTKGDTPAISKQFAGRLLHEALKLEIDRTHNQSVNDWQADQRFQAILGLLKRVEYPLHKAQLEALASVTTDGQKLKIHENTRRVAREHLASLNDTAPRNPGDQVAQAKFLQETIAERGKLLKGMEDEKSRQVNDRRSDDQRLEDQAKISGKDAQSTRTAIIQACSGDPIRRLDDPRIAHLQTLLKDPNKGVAMTAAWFLLNAGNPENTNDQALLNSLKDEPWFKEAYAKLQDISRTANPNEMDALWKADAQRYLRVLEAWDVAVKNQPPLAVDDNLAGDQKVFAESKAILDGSRPAATLDEKKSAIENLVRLGSFAYAKGDVETQRRAEEVLRQVAAAGDLVLAQSAFEAYQKYTNDRSPLSDDTVGNGDRWLRWENGKSTRIESGADFKKISYPDGKWLRLSLDEHGKVKSYTSSEFSGEKKAGQDFAHGSINMNNDGSVTFDEANGMRRIRRASGESWTFLKAPADAIKSGKELSAVLKGSRASAEDKIAAIEKSLSNSNFNGFGIKAADDPRLTLLKDALKDSDARVKTAAAKALLDHGNTGVDEASRRSARDTYLNAGLGSDASPTDAVARLKESIDLVGPITDANDPRLAKVNELLSNEDPSVRADAAAMILRGGKDKFINKAFTDEHRKKALETLESDCAQLIEKGIAGESGFAHDLLDRLLQSKDSNLTKSSLATYVSEKSAGWEKASQLLSKHLGESTFVETLADGSLRKTRKVEKGLVISAWKNGELTRVAAPEGVKYADLLVKDLSTTGQTPEQRLSIAKAIIEGKVETGAGAEHKAAALKALSELSGDGSLPRQKRLHAAELFMKDNAGKEGLDKVWKSLIDLSLYSETKEKALELMLQLDKSAAIVALSHLKDSINNDKTASESVRQSKIDLALALGEKWKAEPQAEAYLYQLHDAVGRLPDKSSLNKLADILDSSKPDAGLSPINGKDDPRIAAMARSIARDEYDRVALNAALALVAKDAGEVSEAIATDARVHLLNEVKRELEDLRRKDSGEIPGGKPADADWAKLDYFMDKIGQDKKDYSRLYIESKRLELKQDYKTLATVYEDLAKMSKERGSESGERLYSQKAAEAKQLSDPEIQESNKQFHTAISEALAARQKGGAAAAQADAKLEAALTNLAGKTGNDSRILANAYLEMARYYSNNLDKADFYSQKASDILDRMARNSVSHFQLDMQSGSSTDKGTRLLASRPFEGSSGTVTVKDNRILADLLDYQFSVGAVTSDPANQAKQLAQQIAAEREAVFGKNSVQASIARENLGDVLLLSGNRNDAEAAYRESLNSPSTIGADRGRLSAKVAQAAMFKGPEGHQEAVQIMEDSLNKMQMEGTPPNLIIAQMQQYANLMQQRGDMGKAQELRNRAIQYQNTGVIPPPTSPGHYGGFYPGGPNGAAGGPPGPIS